MNSATAVGCRPCSLGGKPVYRSTFGGNGSGGRDRIARRSDGIYVVAFGSWAAPKSQNTHVPPETRPRRTEPPGRRPPRKKITEEENDSSNGSKKTQPKKTPIFKPVDLHHYQDGAGTRNSMTSLSLLKPVYGCPLTVTLLIGKDRGWRRRRTTDLGGWRDGRSIVAVIWP